MICRRLAFFACGLIACDRGSKSDFGGAVDLAVLGAVDLLPGGPDLAVQSDLSFDARADLVMDLAAPSPDFAVVDLSMAPDSSSVVVTDLAEAADLAEK